MACTVGCGAPDRAGALRPARVARLAQSFRGHRVARMLMSFDRAIALLRRTRHEDPRAGSDCFNQSQKDPPSPDRRYALVSGLLGRRGRSVEHKETLIRVQSDWNAWRTAEVRLGDLQNIHWRQPRGAPSPLVHGHVSCSSIVSGDIPHRCTHADAPHRLLVCVLKRHTIPAAYTELTRRADAQPTSLPDGWRSLGR